MRSATHSTDTTYSFLFTVMRLGVVGAIGLSMLGCRSGRPSNSMVQVTEDPTAIVADLPAPQQRLATTAHNGKQNASLKPRDMATISTATKSTPAGVVAGMPEVFQEKQLTTGTSARMQTQMSLTDSKTTAATDSKAAASEQPPAGEPKQNPHVSEVAEAKPKADATPKSNETSADDGKLAATETKIEKPLAADKQPDSNVEVSATGLVSASLTDLSAPADLSTSDLNTADLNTAAKKTTSAKTVAAEPDQLVQSAPKQRPDIQRPEVQRPAVKQTEYPNDMIAALRSSLAELPELPDASGKSYVVIPKRIGTGLPRLAAQETTSPLPPGQSLEETAIDDLIADAEESVEDQIPTSVGDSIPSAPTLASDEEPSVVMNANQVRPVSHDGGDARIGMASLQDETPIRSLGAEQPTPELSEEELFQQLLSRISQPQPNESPIQRERRQIVTRHLMVLAGDPENAIQALEGLNPSEQQYLKNQLLGLWTLIDPEGHPSSGRRITEALPKFREATRYMAAATDSLALNCLEFCTEIESYGQIKPFEGNRFVAGQQVILYCEIENFAADARNGYFQTQLQGSYDIYDVNGTKVISQLLPVDQQRSRNRLRDYFVAYQMNLPKGLPPGTYRLQLTIEDIVGKKYGQSNIPFEIR